MTYSFSGCWKIFRFVTIHPPRFGCTCTRWPSSPDASASHLTSQALTIQSAFEQLFLWKPEDFLLKTVRLGLAKPLIVSARLKRNSDNPRLLGEGAGISVHFSAFQERRYASKYTTLR